MNREEELKWLIQPFNDAVDSHELRREWEEWHRCFGLVLERKKIASQKEKFVTMLACGGRGLQRIYFNLPASSDESLSEPVAIPLLPKEDPDYENALIRLNKFFIGKRNERVELEQFRSLKQKVDEPFNQFALKLRRQASRCDFGTREDNEILHQIAMGARDEKVRDKGLENTMDLDQLTNYAINREVLLMQKEREKPFRADGEAITVSHVGSERARMPPPNRSQFYKGKGDDSQKKGWTNPTGTTRSWSKGSDTKPRSGRRPECGNCGSYGHESGSKFCPGNSISCNNCGRLGHFARKCRQGRGKGAQQNPRVWKKEVNSINQSGHIDDLEDDEENFEVKNNCKKLIEANSNGGCVESGIFFSHFHKFCNDNLNDKVEINSRSN